MPAAGILKLQRAGFTEQQVEALAEYFDEQMATKADLAAAEARLSASIEQLRADIAAVHAVQKTLDARVHADQQTLEARLETKIEQARSDTIKWVVGVAFAQVAMLVAVLKLFAAPHP